MNSMHIKLKNTSNTRTLSHLKNKEGKTIKEHYLLRSDSLNKLDEEDIKVLKEKYKLRRIIDLRSENEIYNKPDVSIPGVEYIENSILPNETLGITKKGNNKDDFNDFVHGLQASGLDSSIEFMRVVYRSIIKSEYANNAYKKFIDILATPVDGATLWHCSAGKDRAGFATILILYILDFNLEDIFEDYLLTNKFYVNDVAKLEKVFGTEYHDILWSVFGVYKEYIDVMLEEINKTYGSFDNYVKDVLAVDSIKKARLKALYLEG